LLYKKENIQSVNSIIKESSEKKIEIIPTEEKHEVIVMKTEPKSIHIDPNTNIQKDYEDYIKKLEESMNNDMDNIDNMDNNINNINNNNNYDFEELELYNKEKQSGDIPYVNIPDDVSPIRNKKKDSNNAVEKPEKKQSSKEMVKENKEIKTNNLNNVMKKIKIVPVNKNSNKSINVSSPGKSKLKETEIVDINNLKIQIIQI
jgi:hypothetical protein